MVLQAPLWLEGWEVRSIRSDIYAWQGNGQVRGVYVDGERVGPGWSSPDPRPLVIDEGDVVIGIMPLLGRRHGAPTAMRIGEVGNLLVISTWSYQGEPSSFSAHDMAKLGLGFICEVRHRDEIGGAAGMRALLARARVLDQLYGGRRRVTYARDDLRLSTMWCPYTGSTYHDSINGLDDPCPRFAYSDGTHSTLPGAKPVPAPGFIDWEWLQTQHERAVETYNPVE